MEQQIMLMDTKTHHRAIAALFLIPFFADFKTIDGKTCPGFFSSTTTMTDGRRPAVTTTLYYSVLPLRRVCMRS